MPNLNQLTCNFLLPPFRIDMVESAVDFLVTVRQLHPFDVIFVEGADVKRISRIHLTTGRY